MKQYDYYGRFVTLCSRFIDRSDDYADKEMLRRNNAAQSQMRKLKKRMLEDEKLDLPDLLHRLLKCEDLNAQVEAAELCGKLGLYVDEFMPILEYVQETQRGELASRAAYTYDQQRIREILAMLKKGGVFLHFGGKKQYVPFVGQGITLIEEEGGGEVIRIDEAHPLDADPSDDHPFRHIHYVLDGASGVFQVQSPFGIQVMEIMERNRREAEEYKKKEVS